jgi:arylformamidase
MTRIIDISPPLSERTVVWPGDVPFRHDVSHDMERGDSLTLGSMHTTFHLGAHADAPRHYARGGCAIGERDLDLYYGPCQVLHVQVPRGSRIGPEALGGNIESPRLLLRTDSFPSHETWKDDFNSLSPELVDHVAALGVRLVGIDTPSIDPFDDERLESHQRAARHDMAILEGLVLAHVEPGTYTLLALPLRLASADASPVRAALVRDPT